LKPDAAIPEPPVSIPDGPSAELITPAQAADLLSVNVKVLERWRGTGEGPAFVRLTSKTIRYRPADLADYIAGRVRVSTAA
jgi:hypothetical protein